VSGRFVVEADGGSRGNPGVAGCGAVVRGPEGEVLAERSISLGTTTNNVAEYQGLIAGLRAAAELGADTVDVRMDSKLVVEQMSGRWRVKQPHLQPLVAQATELVGGFAQVSFTWVPRAENAHADRLANEAMDAAASGEQPRDRERAPAVGDEATTRLVLLRHAQTDFSVEGRYCGRGDPQLTRVGWQQARLLARRVAKLPNLPTSGSVVLSSPLRRARQTADEVAGEIGGETVVHDALREADFGEWEGLTFAEAAQRDPELHRKWLSDPSVPPPGGESLDAVHRRVAALRDELVDRYAGRTAVVVSHTTPLKALLRLGLGAGPEVFFRLRLDLASLSIVEFYADGYASVRLVNDTSHLA
jgi:broad specificity phosphatase PhoE/ribonuclease HI